MKMPWGGLQAEAIGAWDELAAAVRKAPGTAIISHEILATASRSQVGRALESVGHGTGTEVHVILSVRDLVRQIPAEWQENVKHRAGAELPGLPQPDPGPRAGEPDRQLVLGRPGDPRHPQPLGPRPAARARAPGHGAAARVEPELLWKRFSHGVRARRPRPRPGGRAGQPVARRPRDRADPPDQPPRQPASCTRRTTGRWCASCSPTRRCPSARRRPGSPCRRTSTPGSRSSPSRGSRRSGAAATTSSASSATWSARPPVDGVRRPGPARRAPGRRRGRRRDQGAAARQRAAAPRGGAAARASSTRRTSRWSAPTCGRRTGCARRSSAGWSGASPGKGDAEGLPRGAGQELAVGVAADPPGRRRRRR